jgi:DNA-binding XRE family transcriptional regulator
MITQSQNPVRFEDKALMVALAMVGERIRELPKEDRADLLELSTAYLASDDQEERDSAALAIMEIFEQVPARVGRMEVPARRGAKLAAWTAYVSRRIRELRSAAGWTQEQLAKEAGLTQSHISRLEAGTHSPNALTIEKLEKALGASIDHCSPEEDREVWNPSR